MQEEDKFLGNLFFILLQTRVSVEIGLPAKSNNRRIFKAKKREVSRLPQFF